MTRTLADVVHVLTRPHATRNGDRVAYVEPLLETLQTCVTNPSSNGGQGGNSTRTGSPINLDALALWESISKELDREWPHAGNPAYVRVPVIQKVHAWHANAVSPAEELDLLERCIRWEDAIRELLDPTKRVPMRGMVCPECKCTHVENDGEDGVTYSPAITVYPTADPVKAECGVCESEWSGKELHDLSAHSKKVPL